VPSTSASSICRLCRLAPPPFQRAVAYGPYRDGLKGAIHAFKYDGMRPAARPLGALLADAIATLEVEVPGGFLVVPVPLHRARRKHRGFNQAEDLSFHALKTLARSHPEWPLSMAPRSLIRLRSTPVQAGLTARQRRLNVRGAFTVSEKSIVLGRHILLVDDVLTTGATARAAGSALLRAGAASVHVATLARAGREHPILRGTETAFDDFDDLSIPPETGAEDRPASLKALATRSISSHRQPSF
jgi:ComF family protein